MKAHSYNSSLNFNFNFPHFLSPPASLPLNSSPTMTSYADGGSSRVSIPHHLRKTIQSIREITGKQHSDEDIFAVYKESFNDPHETAQKLLYLDTFHEVRSKREKKKENLVPITQGSGRNGRRNFASSNTHQDAGNGRITSLKRENGANHVTGGSRTAGPATNRGRNLTGSRAIKVSDPNSVPNGVSNHKTQDGIVASVNNGLGEKHPLSKSNSSSEDDVVPELTKETSELVAAPVSVSVIQNVPSAQISQPVTANQPEELLSFSRQDPSLISASRRSSQSDEVTKKDTASNNGKTQSLLKSDVGGERSHVTFPFHLQVAEVLQNGLTFGSFDSNFVKEASNNGASGGDNSNFESSYGTRDWVSSPTTNGVPGVASAREGASSVSEDEHHGISNSAPGAELVVHPDHIVLSIEDEHQEEALPNTETQQIAHGQDTPLSVFGLVPSLSAIGQPVNTEAAEAQPGNSNAPAIPLASYPPEHLFRQQYPPHFYPYGPYYPPYYMPPPYIHQFLGPNGIPQQSYFPPGAALAAPSPINPLGNTENPPTTNTSPHASSTVATALNSIPSEERTTPLTESAAAWIGQGLSNLQVNPMYNLAVQGQPLGFPVVQAGHGGLMGIHQPTQPMASASTTYQTFPPPPLPLPHTTTAMAEPVGHAHIAYQQPQTNWVNNY